MDNFLDALHAALNGEPNRTAPSVNKVPPRPEAVYSFDVKLQLVKRHTVTVTVCDDTPSYDELRTKALLAADVDPDPDWEISYVELTHTENEDELEEWDDLYGDEYDEDGNPLDF